MIRIQSTLLAVALTLSACQFAKDPDKDKVDAAEVKVVVDEVQRQQDENLAAVLTDSDVVVDFTPLPEPHQYEMTVRWPERVPMVRLTISRGGHESVSIQRDESFHTVQIVSGQANIQVSVEGLNRLGHTISRVSKTTNVPHDEVIHSIALNEPLSIQANRVFLMKNGGIFTYGNDLNIVTNHLIIETDQTIATTQRYDDQDSSSDPNLLAGKINIQAQKITGHLAIHLYGLNGADGRDGSILETLAGVQPPAHGVPGSAGRNGVLDLGCEPVLNEHRFIRTTDLDKCRRQSQVICEVPPTNGTDGQDAPKAMDGENGFDGGNTGDLVLNTEVLEGSLTIRRINGKGGQGGQAAPVRDGGLGGAAGALDPQRLCPPAQAGKNGARGAAGRDGDPGKPGQIGLLILPTDPDIRRLILVDDSRLVRD